jgi:chromate transport protein ChrA
MKLFSRLNVRPIEALMVGWTILAFFAIPLWKSTWTMPTMVVLLLAAVVVGYILEPRESPDSGSSDDRAG